MNEPIIDSYFRILENNDTYVVVEKSGNCPVHEASKYKENTLRRLVWKKINHEVWPIYRIDRETSGIVVFAKNPKNIPHIKITNKIYYTICKNYISPQLIDKPIGECKGTYVNWKKCIDENGLPSKTEVLETKQYNNYTLARINLLTGRQHQIRVHLESIKAPIVGDKIYGENEKLMLDYLNGKPITGDITRQALHLFSVTVNGEKYVCEIPNDMKNLLKKS